MFQISADIFKTVKEIPQRLLTVGDEKFLILLGCGAIALFCAFCIARIVFRSARREGPAPAMLDDDEMSAVTAASLQAVESRLRGSGAPDALIAVRLQDAKRSLERLRARLANVAPHALYLVDRGDFEAASISVRKSCESNTGRDEPGGRQKAALYADAALIDHLRLDYRAAAANYAAAADLASRFEDPAARAGDEWRLRMEQARALAAAAARSDDRAIFLTSIEIYDRALRLVARDRSPLDWAATQFHRGDALQALGLRDYQPARIEEAVACYNASLEEWTREAAAFDWAKTQHNLGDALQRLSEMENGVERLQPAVDAYRAALEEWTRDAAPALFAMAQANLGDALALMGVQNHDAAKLSEAIDAYEAALSGLRQDLSPEEWARTQDSLANAIEALAEQDFRQTQYGLDELKQAVAAFEAVLEERAAEAGPAELAQTSASLGDALLALGERESAGNPAYGADLLQRAAKAYRAALLASGEMAAPDVAKIRVSLAYALGLLWNSARDRAMLNEALAMVDAAIVSIKNTRERSRMPEAEQARKIILAALAKAA